MLSIFAPLLFLVSTSSPCENASWTFQNDTTYHRYINGAVSVMYTPWVDEVRSLHFYDLYGKLTYSIEELQKADSTRVRLEFHPNGGVKLVEVFTNSASDGNRNVSRISLNSTNNPEHRIDNEIGSDGLEQTEGTRYYWKRNDNVWALPEVIKCQPVPEAYRGLGQ